MTGNFIKSRIAVALLTLSVSCNTSPTEPTPPRATPPSLAAPTRPSVTAIVPGTGSVGRETRVQIVGSGFEPGATVTLGRTAFEATVVNTGTLIHARASPHDAGTVDVIVTNPDGQTGMLAGGFTYAVDPPVAGGPAGSAPTVTAITPQIVPTGGGAPIAVSGTGLLPGAIVVLGGAALGTRYVSGEELRATAPARGPGTVDVAVLNPDGQSGQLRAGFTYVLPQHVDFSGIWNGQSDDRRDSHRWLPMSFTIEHGVIVTLSCGPETLTLSPAVSAHDGEFAFSTGNGASVSGRFLTSSLACGRIELADCGRTWCAAKQ